MAPLLNFRKFSEMTSNLEPAFREHGVGYDHDDGDAGGSF